MTKDNRTQLKTKKGPTKVVTPIIYEIVSMECVVADVDPRIVAQMKKTLRSQKCE